PVNTDRPAAPPARGAADQKAGGNRLSRAATTNHRERDDDRAPGGARRRRRRPRERERRRKAARRTGSALGHLLLQVLVQRGEEFLGGQPLLVLADEQRQVLGHLAALDGLDDDLLQGLGEAHDLRGGVELAALLQAAGPGEDRGDRVGGGRLALLVLPVVAGHRAVGGLGLDRAVLGHQHGGHQAQRAEALGDG